MTDLGDIVDEGRLVDEDCAQFVTITGFVSGISRISAEVSRLRFVMSCPESPQFEVDINVPREAGHMFKIGQRVALTAEVAEDD
jgi:hypothetical protein